MSHLRFEVDPQLSRVAESVRLSVPASSMFTHAVTPLENSTSLQLVLCAEASDASHPKIPIRLTLNKSFFIVV
jgi:hypothetical protein